MDVGVGPLMAHVAASLDGLGGRMDRLDARYREMMKREAMRARTPIDVRVWNSATSPSSGDFGISIGDGPDAGYYWLVRRVIVGGINPSSNPTGTLELYVTALAGPRGGPHTGPGTVAGIRNTNDCVDFGSSLPFKNFYGPHQLIVQENENLVAVIHGPAATTLYLASAQVQVIRTTAAATVYEE